MRNNNNNNYVTNTDTMWQKVLEKQNNFDCLIESVVTMVPHAMARQ